MEPKQEDKIINQLFIVPTSTMYMQYIIYTHTLFEEVELCGCPVPFLLSPNSAIALGMRTLLSGPPQEGKNMTNDAGTSVEMNLS